MAHPRMRSAGGGSTRGVNVKTMHPSVWLALGFCICRLTYFDWSSALMLDAAATTRLLSALLAPVVFWLLAIFLPMGVLVWRECEPRACTDAELRRPQVSLAPAASTQAVGSPLTMLAPARVGARTLDE